MPNSPKKNEEIMQKALNALRDIAPDVKFNNKTLADLLPQVEKSMTPRRRLAEIENERTQQIALRESEDVKTLKLIDQIIAGTVGHDDYGDDSALYEAFGFIRKSQRKSGLTRRGKIPETQNP
ncbi:MAG: hypothetical protein ABJA66_06875 [Actinomycetota bacterium]